MQFGLEIVTLSHIAYITVDFKKLISDLYHAGYALTGKENIYQEKNEDIRIAPKHKNSLKTFPYATQKHLEMHQSDFTPN